MEQNIRKLSSEERRDYTVKIDLAKRFQFWSMKIKLKGLIHQVSCQKRTLKNLRQKLKEIQQNFPFLFFSRTEAFAGVMVQEGCKQINLIEESSDEDQNILYSPWDIQLKEKINFKRKSQSCSVRQTQESIEMNQVIMYKNQNYLKKHRSNLGGWCYLKIEQCEEDVAVKVPILETKKSKHQKQNQI